MYGATRNLRLPPIGAQVNWGHPLARGLTAAHLFNGGGGQSKYSVNLVDSAPWVAPNANLPVPKVRQPGAGVDTTSAGAVYRLTSPSTAKFQASTASLFWYGIPLSTGVSHQAYIIGVSALTAGGNCYAIQRDPTVSDTNLYVVWNNGSLAGNAQSLTISSAWTDDRSTSVGMTIDGTTVTAYVAGLNVGSTSTGVGTISFSGTNYLCIGGGSQNANNDTSAIFSVCAYFWNRALTANEMLMLNFDPFAPIRLGPLIAPQIIPGSATGLQSSMVIPILTIQQW